MFTIHATFDQFENDEMGDYGIVNVWINGKHYYDVADCEGFDINAEVSRLTGLNHVKMFREPFNPYGDGFTYNGMGKMK